MKKMITRLTEASYPNNIGFEELVLYFRVGTDEQINDIELAIEDGDFEKVKELIYNVLGVQLM